MTTMIGKTLYSKLMNDERPVLLYFSSDKQGGHFNCTFRDFDQIRTMIRTTARQQLVRSEEHDAIRRLNAFEQQLKLDGYNANYRDVWISFSTGAWLTVTYNPHTQEIYKIPLVAKRRARNERLLKDGTPTKIRVYHWSHYNRPKEQRQFDYIIVFGRNQKGGMGNKGLGRYHRRLHFISATDPKQFFQRVERLADRDIDRLGKQGQTTLPLGKAMTALGRRIQFRELPQEVRRLILREYIAYWEISDKPAPKFKYPSEFDEAGKQKQYGKKRDV